MDWSAIGKRIRQQREYMGFTREQFAEQIDVTPKFCSDIETGAKGCPFLHFAGFPKYFVCPPITSFMEKRNRKIPIPL